MILFANTGHKKLSVSTILLFIGICLSKMDIVILFYELLRACIQNSKQTYTVVLISRKIEMVSMMTVFHVNPVLSDLQ